MDLVVAFGLPLKQSEKGTEPQKRTPIPGPPNDCLSPTKKGTWVWHHTPGTAPHGYCVSIGTVRLVSLQNHPRRAYLECDPSLG